MLDFPSYLMGIILLTFYCKGSEEKSKGTQIFNGSGTIMAKNQELVGAAGNELAYLMRQAKEASENMSEAKKQKTIERMKKAGEDKWRYSQIKDIIEFSERYIPQNLGSMHMNYYKCEDE